MADGELWNLGVDAREEVERGGGWLKAVEVRGLGLGDWGMGVWWWQ